MSRSNDIASIIASDVTIAGDKTFTGDIIPSSPLSHRNMIINGAMNIAQRGTSGTGANAVIAIDRYKRVADNNGAVTTSQVTDAPTGFKNSYKATITSADTSIASAQYEFVEHTIEGQNTIPLALGTSSAKQITLSFYVKSSLAGIFGGVFKNKAQNRSYPYQYTINSANTWERKTITLTGDTSGTWATDNTAGLKVQWSLGSGTDYHATANAWGTGNMVTPNVARSGATSGTDGALLANVNATWQITGVQLELGDNATPFEHRSYGDDLLRCQRYYHTILTLASPAGVLGYTRVSGSVVRGAYQLATTMRAAGTLVESHSDIVYRFNGTSSHNNNSTTPSIDIMADYGGTIDFGGFSGLPTDGQGGIIRITSGTSGAHLALSSEL